MTSTHKIPKKLDAILAILFIIPPLYIYIIWVTVASDNNSQIQNVKAFTDHFPRFVSDVVTLAIISIICCIVALIFAAKSFKQPILFLRITSWLVVIIGAFLLFLNLFQFL